MRFLPPLDGPTILQLLDPASWETIAQEANADLFVAWDALSLSEMGRERREEGRILAHQVDDATWSTCREEELRLLHWANGVLQHDTRVAVEQVIREIYLAPVYAVIGEGRPIQGRRVGTHIDWGDHTRTGIATWEVWVGELGQRLRTPVNVQVGTLRVHGVSDRSSVVYLLGGLNLHHRPHVAPHHLPMIPGTTWGDVVEGVRWILAMAWFSELQGRPL